MPQFLQAGAFDREGLAVGLANLSGADLRSVPIDDLSALQFPERGGILVRWDAGRGDLLPDVLIVRDEDLADILAWLSSYFAAFSPITQWCRVLTRSEAQRLAQRQQLPSLADSLGLWVGAILAECSAQSMHHVNLRELPGTAALTSATFAAARAVAVWGKQVDLVEIGKRHEELTVRLRDTGRPILAQSLLPLWNTLVGSANHSDSDAERSPLRPIEELIQRQSRLVGGRNDASSEVLSEVSDRLALPELVNCARGPQLDRVRALDLLAQKLTSAPKYPAAEAVLGLAASLVDPGSAVLPDLLRKYSGTMPRAALWLGAFAGVWSPARVLSDHQGLGRLIAKALVAQDDLRSKPSCDIAYNEIVRWLGATGSNRPVIRGMAARSLNVELMVGVTCPFAVGRVDTSRTDQLPTYSASRSDHARLDTIQRDRSATGGRALPEIVDELEALVRRVDRLEESSQQMADLLRSFDRPADLLGRPEKGGASSSRPTRRSTSRQK